MSSTTLRFTRFRLTPSDVLLIVATVAFFVWFGHSMGEAIPLSYTPPRTSALRPIVWLGDILWPTTPAAHPRPVEKPTTETLPKTDITIEVRPSKYGDALVPPVLSEIDAQLWDQLSQEKPVSIVVRAEPEFTLVETVGVGTAVYLRRDDNYKVYEPVVFHRGRSIQEIMAKLRDMGYPNCEVCEPL